MVDPARQGPSPYVFCGNNSISYYDEDGQFWFLFAAMVIWNAAYYGSYEMNHGGQFWSWDGAGKGAVIGAFSSLVVAGSAALAVKMGITGAIGGAAFGAVSGGVIGGITSEIAGGRFCDGFYTGAIAGGIVGGFQGYEMAQKQGRNPWTGEEITARRIAAARTIAERVAA